jgi:hypothetical protein
MYPRVTPAKDVDSKQKHCRQVQIRDGVALTCGEGFCFVSFRFTCTAISPAGHRQNSQDWIAGRAGDDSHDAAVRDCNGRSNFSLPLWQGGSADTESGGVCIPQGETQTSPG